MGLLIDSSILIGLERRGVSPTTLTEDDGDFWAISAVTVSELLFGLHRARTSAQRMQREAFINATLALLPVLPFDLSVAEVHARTWAALAAAGQRIGAHDMMIAATALAHHYALLTENVHEFRRIPGLEVQEASW